MEDRKLPITVGQGAGAASSRSTCREFTLIGATTRTGLLTTPLRDRFGVTHRLELYGAADLGRIVRRSAGILDVEIDDAGRRGDRRALARHAARGEPAAQARARLRRGARRGPHRRERWRARRSTCSRWTPAGLDRLDREILRAICAEVRRRPGRALDPRRGGRRGAGHDRGRLRAVPAPAGPHDAHAARPRRDRGRLRAPRPRAAARGRALVCSGIEARDGACRGPARGLLRSPSAGTGCVADRSLPKNERPAAKQIRTARSVRKAELRLANARERRRSVRDEFAAAVRTCSNRRLARRFLRPLLRRFGRHVPTAPRDADSAASAIIAATLAGRVRGDFRAGRSRWSVPVASRWPAVDLRVP